ncbi:MAG: leucine-rich repeat domain-containing protein, partial [Allobaculum sp.]|nr:leucine-rich repeat domain-containing protein [Allobaculum sp.]
MGYGTNSNGLFYSAKLESVYIGRNLIYPSTSGSKRCPFYAQPITSVTIGEKVESVGPELFKGCTRLTSIVLPESVKLIEESAFESCTGLTTAEMSKVALIHKNAFKGCTSLTNVNVGSNARVLENSAFEGCASLKSINLPKVALIYSDAFKDCSGLQSVIMGPDIRTIDANAFNGCTGMKNMYVYSDEAPACDASTFTNVPVITDIHVIKGSRSQYERDEVWNRVAVITDDLNGDEDPGETDIEFYAIG